MASGKLGSAALVANTDTKIYTVPDGKLASINVCVVNRGALPSKVRVALGPNDAPANADYIEYDVEVPGHSGVLERTAQVMGAGEKVVVRDSTGTCSVRVHGFEEDA